MNELIARIKNNPKTSALGVICVGMYGAGEAMRANALEPWGSIVIGVAGVLTLVGLALAKDAKKKDGE